MQQSGLNRNTIDKFYTKPEIVDLCLELFNNNVNLLSSDHILEPSAGNGEFSKKLKQKYSNTILTYDIDPEDATITKQDYLTLELDTTQTYHVIGNPPFGRQSSLARKFIKKSCSFAYSISFILPKSFKKQSFMSSFDKYFHLIVSQDLPESSFYYMDVDFNIPCVFQIWLRKETQREIPQTQIPKYFKFIKKHENPDFALRRVGFYAGSLYTNPQDKSEQSHYFITLDDNIDKTEFHKIVNNLLWEHDNTVGAKSISKREFINKLNQLY